MTELTDHWNQRYATGNTPWNSGLPSQELRRVLAAEQLAPCRALELGCGSGTNAVYLAELGFDVTGIDCSALALDRARALAASRGVNVCWICADVCDLEPPKPAYDFLFDRGCYHCARRVDLPGFLKTLERAAAPGAKYLVLTGNPKEKREPGPPVVAEHEIHHELGGLFVIEFIREFHFEDAGGVQGPLGWSCLLTRRS